MNPFTSNLSEFRIPRHVEDAMNHAIHTSDIDGNECPISLCYVAVKAALKAYVESENPRD